MGEKLLFIVFFIATSCIGLWHLRENKKKKELIVLSSLLLLNGGVLLAHLIDVNIKSPLDAITFIYQPISDFVMKQLL